MKKLAALFFLCTYASFSFACSTFLLGRNGRFVFGRNYDWVTGSGMAVVNARGVQKTSFSPAGQKKVHWVSQCGSITFNQYGKEFPHGGMNEAGLVVELMWLSGTVYPSADERAVMNELQWIQYQLDNCSTVEEVLATDRHIRIGREGAVPLHYLVADALGNAATIEFVDGRMVVHRGSDLPHPVLTNTVYADALRRFGQQKERAGASTGDNSVDRFATACSMVQQFEQTEQEPVGYAFRILNNIAQGSYTKWRIVYDITSRKIYFNTNGSGRRQLSFSDFDFSCSRQPLAFDLSARGEGAVAAFFSPLDYSANKALLERSALESRSLVSIPAAQINRAAGYFNEVGCAK